MIFDHKGILGINARNLLYIRPYNPKKAIKFADDKLKTKQFLSAREIPVPKLYNTIKSYEDLDKFDFNSLPNAFVLKPNKGYGGEGIIPVTSKREGYYVTAGGKQLSQDELKDHIKDILDGRFSISNVSDIAFFEQLIIADEKIGKYSYEGLPDIRIVVHNLIPVMGMLRLPTRESEGKANLHMGAIGVGIDIAKGEVTHATYKNKIIHELNDNLGQVRGLKIPYWDEMLLIASKVQLLSNLGYMAIDLCIDKNTGPVLLEINARAGLGVQIANLAPLRKRLERIEGVKVGSPVKGVRIAKDMFGNTVEKEIKHISGKEIIGIKENIEIIQKNGTFKVKAKINTGGNVTTIDESIALKNGLLDDLENYDDEKGTLKIKFSLRGKRIQTVANVEKFIDQDHGIVIGSRDLKDFLIDSSQEKIEQKKKNVSTEENTHPKNKINYSKVDQQLIQIDSKIKLLYHLRPLNLEEEKRKFLSSKSSNPQFEYPQLKFDPIELTEDLNKIKTDDSPLGHLFDGKKQEVLNKIRLIESIDEEEFTNLSIKLFSKPSFKEFEECKELISAGAKGKGVEEQSKITAEEAAGYFQKTFEKYGLKSWKVKIKESMVADCVAGKNNRLFVKADAKFTKERIESLIVHEIETHILTAENGKMQPYEIFNRGLANYLTTQEGMAMYNVEKQRKKPFDENYKALSNVIAIYKSLEGSFADAFKELIDLGISEEQAFRSCLKAKRGLIDTGKSGAFTKDYVYLEGYKQVKKFIDDGGKLEDLYIGKMNINDLKTVKEVTEVRHAKILPVWLKQ